MKKIIYILIFCIVTFGLFFSINNHSILSTFAEEKQNTKKYSYENRFLSKVSSILGVEKSDLSKAIKQAKKEIMDENLQSSKKEIKSGQIFQDLDNKKYHGKFRSKKSNSVKKLLGSKIDKGLITREEAEIKYNYMLIKTAVKNGEISTQNAKEKYSELEKSLAKLKGKKSSVNIKNKDLENKINELVNSGKITDEQAKLKMNALNEKKYLK